MQKLGLGDANALKALMGWGLVLFSVHRVLLEIISSIDRYTYTSPDSTSMVHNQLPHFLPGN